LRVYHLLCMNLSKYIATIWDLNQILFRLMIELQRMLTIASS